MNTVARMPPLVEAAAKGGADDGRGPETSRRGQTLDALPLGNDDGARTDEANTRNNLCTEGAPYL